MTEPSAQDKLSARYKTLFDSHNLPNTPGGFGVAVIKDGNMVFKKAYGFANYEHQIPFTTSTVTDYASAAKQFTGFAVATLAQCRKLRLDDDIHCYLSGLPDFGEKITIRQLLHHTSGIRDWVGLVKISGRHEGDIITDDFLMELVSHQKELNFKPGDRFQYSNTGYFLLAHIVAQITNQSFTQWTHNHIFEPLEMDDTHFCEDYREIIRNRASSYKQNETGEYVNAANQLESPGSSSLFSTLDDMVKWMKNYETKKLGGPEIWKMMCQPGTLSNNQEINYGFGISLDSNQGLESIGHGGSWAGNLCQLSYYPKQKITYILSINRDPAGFYVDPSELIKIQMDSNKKGNVSHGQTPNCIEIKINPELLAYYAGTYLTSSGEIIWVEHQDEQLMILSPSGQRVLVYPEREDIFFGRDFKVRFSFFRDEAGTINRFTYSAGGNNSEPFWKQNEHASLFDDLDAFCGDYYCPELQTTYTVLVKNNHLILEHLQNEEVRLHPMGQDNFKGNKWWCTEINITRDTKNQISGFKLNADGNNIQDLLFVRRAVA